MSTPALVDAFYARIWNAGDLDATAELLAADLSFRGSLGPELRGREAFEGYVRSVRGSLSEFRCEILACVAEGDQAFAKMRFSGFHTGSLRGYEPTGVRVEWLGAALFRFEHDRIAALWVLGDLAALDATLERTRRTPAGTGSAPDATATGPTSPATSATDPAIRFLADSSRPRLPRRCERRPQPVTDAAPLVVYGTDCSYYTGKLEAYLRAKGIPYRLEPFGESNMRHAARHTGVSQIPQVECPDGSWLVDTTLIIEYFERVRPEPAVTPREPAVAWVSRLLEDYADEWLWRPAMHYRWSYPETARLMSAWLAEHVRERRAPEWLKRRFWLRRQLGTFVTGDGVTAETRAAVERCYLDTLDTLEAIFQRRPWMLGERPTEADFGFFASMFRHFFSDPAPGRIMRARAPGVHEWVARLWNVRLERLAATPLPDRLPDDLGALLGAVTDVYLPYLDANAAAHARGEKSVRYQALGTTFSEPVKPYRVWCRDRLHAALVGLDASAKAEVQRVLGSSDALARLATPSPKPAESVIAALPLTTPAASRAVDSWWRS